MAVVFYCVFDLSSYSVLVKIMMWGSDLWFMLKVVVDIHSIAAEIILDKD